MNCGGAGSQCEEVEQTCISCGRQHERIKGTPYCSACWRDAMALEEVAVTMAQRRDLAE